MIDKNKKISLAKVDLIEFLKFYKNEICSYSYKYTLENDLELILSFKEENFSHLLGLHKFKKINSYKSSLEINDEIMNKNIILKEISKYKKVCIPVSFLVDRNDRFSKMKLKELKIKEINIIKK